jgi:hypothetical protein
VGFSDCDGGSPESGFEKIAVYATTHHEYTHAAFQLASGAWTSKLGAWVLIEHDTPGAVAGGAYGHLIGFLKRPIPPSRTLP